MICARCGSKRHISYRSLQGRIQTGGTKTSIYGYKRFQEYTASVPVCLDCSLIFKKYRNITAVLILAILIEMFVGLGVSVNWVDPVFNSIFLITMICLMVITSIILGVFRVSGISPGRYMKFKKIDRAFYVKPKGAKAWINLNIFKNYIDIPRKDVPQKKTSRKALVYFNSGIKFSMHGNLEQALENFDKSLEISPEFADALEQKGIILSKFGKNEEALEYLEKALIINPNLAFANDFKKSIYKKLGREYS